MKFQRFLDRLVASASFSAYLWLLRLLPDGVDNTLVRGFVPLWVAGVLVSDRLRGVQNVFALLAGQGLASLVPMPAEPGGYLILPAVLFYFGLIATVGWALDQCLRLTRASATAKLSDTFASVFEQYLSLFAVTRAAATFTDAGQDGALIVVSLAYMGLPEAVAPCGTVFAQRFAAAGAWPRYFVRNFESLAVRGTMLWVLARMASVAGAAGNGSASGGGAGIELLGLQIIAVYATGADEDAQKLGHIHAILSLTTAQNVVGALQRSGVVSMWICAWALAAGVALLLVVSGRHEPQPRHSFADVCAFGVSLLLTAALERWLSGSGALEAATTYLVVFSVLEVLHAEPWSPAARGGSAMPAQSALGLAIAVEDGLAIW